MIYAANNSLKSFKSSSKWFGFSTNRDTKNLNTKKNAANQLIGGIFSTIEIVSILSDSNFKAKLIGHFQGLCFQVDAVDSISPLLRNSFVFHVFELDFFN